MCVCLSRVLALVGVLGAAGSGELVPLRWLLLLPRARLPLVGVDEPFLAEWLFSVLVTFSLR